jgi:hypothetical protein
MMGKPARVGFVSAIVLALICGGVYAFNERADVAEAQPDTIVGVDANPAGNTATSLATINSCISVSSTDTFYIDLFIQDVTNLNSWEGTFRFDESVLDVNSLAVAGFFLGSSTYGPIFSCTVGECLLGTFDTTGTGHDGEGVLGRLEITAIGPGISKANLDLRSDGLPASGVILLDDGDPPAAIGDFDPPEGDGYFDGTILNANIAVDQPCPGECQPDVDTDGDGFDDDVECYLPTDQNDDCTDEIGVHDAWPLDINIDKSVTVVGDVLPFYANIGAPVGGDPILQRMDLNADGTITVVGDVLPFRDHIGDECS